MADTPWQDTKKGDDLQWRWCSDANLTCCSCCCWFCCLLLLTVVVVFLFLLRVVVVVANMLLLFLFLLLLLLLLFFFFFLLLLLLLPTSLTCCCLRRRPPSKSPGSPWELQLWHLTQECRPNNSLSSSSPPKSFSHLLASGRAVSWVPSQSCTLLCYLSPLSSINFGRSSLAVRFLRNKL